MALTDYSSLKTSVASYLARSDLTDQIPDFIRLAEERLARDLRTRKMLVVARADTTCLAACNAALAIFFMSVSPCTAKLENASAAKINALVSVFHQTTNQYQPYR